MAKFIRDRATRAPGYSTFGEIVHDPVTATAVRFMREVAGLFDFGISFPYNNASTTDTTISGATNLTAYVNEYRDLTVNDTLTATVSPCFIFARTVTLGASGIIDGDGQGAAGGAGGNRRGGGWSRSRG